MNRSPNSPNRKKVKRSSDPGPTPDNFSDEDPKSKETVSSEILNILRGIPVIGPIIVVFKLKWGWVGTLSLLAGFVVAIGLARADVLPDWIKPPAARQSAGYELLANDKVPWDTLVREAKHEIRAAGVRWSLLNPQLIVNKVAEGTVRVRMVMLDPCSAAAKQREVDEGGNMNSTRDGILSHLKKFRTYQAGLTVEQRAHVQRSLEISLSDAYPTGNVLTVDGDLYAYFCIMGERCQNSAVLTFKNYQTSPYGPYFARHLEALFKLESQKVMNQEGKLRIRRIATDQEYTCQ